MKQCMQSYLEVRVLGRIKYENALKEDKSRYYEAWYKKNEDCKHNKVWAGTIKIQEYHYSWDHWGEFQKLYMIAELLFRSSLRHTMTYSYSIFMFYVESKNKEPMLGRNTYCMHSGWWNKEKDHTWKSLDLPQRYTLNCVWRS